MATGISVAAGNFERWFGKALSWSSAVLAPPPITGWMPRMMTARLRRAGCYITTCAVVAASDFNEVTDFGICPDYVVEGMRFDY